MITANQRYFLRTEITNTWLGGADKNVHKLFILILRFTINVKVLAISHQAAVASYKPTSSSISYSETAAGIAIQVAMVC